MLILSLTMITFFITRVFWNFSLVFSFLMVFSVFSVFLLNISYILSPFFYSEISIQTDRVSYTLMYITFIILLLCHVAHTYQTSHYQFTFTILSVLVTSYFVFSRNNFLILYISYEASLIPIVYTILKWGPYPDRQQSALVILIFTSFFTFPMAILILINFITYSSLIFFIINFDTFSLFISLWLLFSFAVKLPVYGLHYWLPIAHVEAPTFGSIILAGLLLKLGGCGLLRILPPIVPGLTSIFRYSGAFVMFGVIFRAILCTFQSDFKRLVAYSSVSHMSVLLLLLFNPTVSSEISFSFLIIFHGVSSPLLFFLVGTISLLYGSRELILTRGLLYFSPFLSFLATLTFLVSIPVPPLPAFFIEVLSFFSLVLLSPLVYPVIALAVFLSLLYSLMWFTSITFSRQQNDNLNFVIRINIHFVVVLFCFSSFSLFAFLII